MSQLEHLAQLLRRRNELDAEIAALIGRPPEKGHVGEFIASHVFDIELHDSAVKKGSDGVFRAGPLAGRSVNIKLYGAREGTLDVAESAPPDVYLVMTGPKRSAATSRGTTRPLVIENVFAFRHADLVAAGVKPGVAASVRQSLWRAAQLFPADTAGTPAPLSASQPDALALFGDETTPRGV